MSNKENLRNLVSQNLDKIINKINLVLQGGEYLETIKPVLNRVSSGKKLPYWYQELWENGTLPNLDGKTIGSIVEMLLVGVLETEILPKIELSINPARGVDLPDLDLGIKSPSENFCTSEPFFSAYERLLGNEYDAIILLTNYQTAKKKPPLKLTIIKGRYLKGSEIADFKLCKLAQKNRQWLLENNPVYAQKIFRFLAYVNQSDWLATKIIKLLDNLQKPESLAKIITEAQEDFERKNKLNQDNPNKLIPEEDLIILKNILSISPWYLGIIDAADIWVINNLKDTARLPNENEWKRLINSPLNGKITMSFALQWRYNFRGIFHD